MFLKEHARAAMGIFYRRKLLAGLDTISRAPLEKLRNRDFVADIIRQIGLRTDRRKLYGVDNKHMNVFGPGLWQIPDQLAGALVFLSNETVTSLLEIGTADGWTSSVMAAYLRRFQPNLRFVTVDIVANFHACARVNQKVPIEYHPTRSYEDVATESFDMVFIDGNHDYEWVARDYERMGRAARLCMFHDIDDLLVGRENVPRFWNELKSTEADESEFVEFTGPSGVMGIGIRKRAGV